MTTHFIETFSGQPSKRSALIAPHSVTGQLCPAGNIGHLLLQAATTERGIVFVRDEHQETRYSYQTLLELARRRLTAFRQLGLKRGDPVMLMFRESADFVISFWAAVLGGMVPAPLAYPAAFHEDNAVLLKLKAVWEQMDRPLIVSDSLLAERQAEMQLALADQRFRVVVASDLAAVELAEPDMAGADDLALVQYSSGSTGQPKGVMLTHANLLTNLEGIIAGAQMTAEDAFISWMPYHHDMGLVGFHLTPMALGTEQINLMPFTFVRKPSLWLDKIHQHRARITGSPNFGYRHLLAKLKPQQLKSWDLSCLRLIFNGAEPISTTVIEDFMAALHPCGLKPSSMYTVFGMAEACLAVSFPPVGSVPRVHWLDRQALAKGQVVRVDPASSGALAMVDEGYPVPGCGIRIVDAEDRVLQEGQVGHVHIGGANVTAGYFRNPAATAACIRNGWLDTGDLGFMIDGRLCISGRHKDIIFVNGQNFYAHDIEAQMDNVAGIEPGKAAACGWQDAESGAERIALFIAMRRPDDGASLAVLKSAWQTINENLGITLDYVVPIKAIPKTTSGKIQRYKLVEDFLAGAFKDQVKTRAQLANVATVTPPTSSPDPVDMLNVVRSVWAEVLGIPMQALAVDRPYRALGGTSIKAVEILGLLEERLQRELNHELLLRCQTIQQMVDWLVGKPVPAEEIPMPVSSSAEAPIAIIGLSCRFPDSDSPEEFWAHINEGRELVGPIPQDRFSPPNGGREAWWRGGFIRDVYGFDAESFGISPEEATDMDPQQRVFLEVAAETLERAGYSRAALNGANVGMFIGASHNNHMEFLVNAMSGESLEDFASLRLMDAQTRAALLEEWQARFGRFAPHVNTAVDNLLNMIAARVSHTFNWKGPSLTVDSACSSSLVAVHLACQSLRLGECAMAIAGGVSLTLSHTPYLLFRRAGALSPSGRCRVFDAGADGFVLGEGAGAVLLKPLAQALADGDPVLAVIRGSAVNNDGQSLGVMAPNPDGQRRVIEAVYRQSGLSPASVQYVEAHGTGTPLGDPSEVRALAQVYADRPRQSCAIGSVKANIGHLLSAAGIASLIKVVLALQHRCIPGNVNLAQPSQQIDFEHSPFAARAESCDWLVPAGAPRRAAINAFGFGGTNCHLLLEEAATIAEQPAAWPAHLLQLSAGNAESAQRWGERLADYLQESPTANLADVCATVNYGRNAYAYRIPLVCSSTEELIKMLRNPAQQPAHEVGKPAQVGLLFTGQGAQYPGMAAFLMQHWPRFRLAMEEVNAAFAPWLSEPLLDSLYQPEAKAERLASTDLTQPAMFAIDYALGRSMLELGVRPAALIGHSVGEYAAACLAGCFSLQDAAKLVAARGRLMAALPKQGGMLAVFAGGAALSGYLQDYDDRLWFAAHNGTHQVIAGYSDALDELCVILAAAGVRFKPLVVSHAFHTPLLEPMLPAFAAVLAEVNFQAPQLPLMSNISGEWFGNEIPNADYWLRHVSAPVHFEQSIRRAFAGGVSAFIECGPDRVLAQLTAAILAGEAVTLTALVDRRREATRTFPEALGALWSVGVEFDQAALQADFPGRRIPLPAYPFVRNTYRLSPPPAAEASTATLLHRWEWRVSNHQDQAEFTLPAGTVVAFVTTEQDAWLAVVRQQLGADRQVLAVRAGAAFSAGPEGWVINPALSEDYLRLWQDIRQNNAEPAAIIHAWNADSNATSGVEEAALAAGAFSFANLAKAMGAAAQSRPCRLLWVSRRAHLSDQLASVSDPYQLLGINFALGYGAEAANLLVQALDLDTAPADPAIEAAVLLAELGTAEFGGGIISIRSGQRAQRCLAMVEHYVIDARPLLNEGDTCLITGGIAGIGAETALSLACSARINLVLTGRTPLPSQDTWANLDGQDPQAERVALLRQLAALGATVEYYVADATDTEAMAQVVDQLCRRFGRLDGVIHCAGVVDRQHIRAMDKPIEAIQAVFAPKLKGTRILHELTINQPLKFFVLYSSLSATSPRWSAGLVDYAAANAYLDGFAEWRSRTAAPGRSLAVNWSLWAGKGMGSDAGLMALVRNNGLRALAPAVACQALQQALSITDAAVIHVIDFEPESTSMTQPAPIALVQQPATPTLPAAIATKPLAAVVPEASWLEQVCALLARCVGCAATEIEASRKFQDMGLDSRGAVEISEYLGSLLGQPVMPTLLFEFQTPLELAAYLQERYGQDLFKNRPSETTSAAPIPTAAPVIMASDKTVSKVGAPDEAIAIIGMGLRIPGAKNTQEYWSMLAAGRSVIREVPEDRWSVHDYFDASGLQKASTYSKWGGFIDNPYDFDAQMFGISPREAKAMDPQQRIFMEVAFEALQQAGYAEEGKATRLGVFVGCENNYFANHFVNLQYYQQLQAKITHAPWYQSLSKAARAEWQAALRDVLQPAELVSDAVAGNGLNEIACRLSHWLNVRGPSMAVNTACSASLVAMHLACQSLRSGESRIAVAGGACLNSTATPYLFLSKVNAMSADGQCRPFDRQANGLVLGEGISALVLKPLSAALADGDPIHGLILGSAMNNDGHSSGLTAPNPAGQAECVTRAYAESGVSPESVSYIECHGTGTALGDPVEVDGMTQAFRRFTDKRGYCGIGSVKSSIGHMLSAAGIPSVIKVLLAMKHEQVPETVNYTEANPYIDFDNSPFYVVGKGGRAWQRDATTPRIAGVNGFGFGGTNCHIILQEPPQLSDQPTGLTFAPAPAAHVLCLTGRSETVLRDYARALHQHLIEQPTLSVAQVALTLNRSQREMPQRAAACVGSRSELLAVLAALAEGRTHALLKSGRANPKQPSAAHWCFDEQPWPTGAADILADRYPVFAESWSEFRSAIGNRSSQVLDAAAEQFALARLLMHLALQPSSLQAIGASVATAAAAANWISVASAVALLTDESVAHSGSAPILNVSLKTANGVVHGDDPELIERLRQALGQQIPATSTSGLLVQLGGANATAQHLRIVSHSQADVSLLQSLAQLYVQGHKAQLPVLYANAIRRVVLPTYPFERKTFLFDAAIDESLAQPDTGSNPLADKSLPTAMPLSASLPPKLDEPIPPAQASLHFGKHLLDELQHLNWTAAVEEELP